MKVPITDITGHVVWTDDGRAHAVYRVSLTAPARPTRRIARQLLDQQTSVLKQLRGEPVVTSLCPRRDLSTVAEQMIEGVDLDALPQWAEAVEGYLDLLADVDMIDRTHWLVLPLSDTAGGNIRAVLREARSSANSMLGEVFGLSGAPITRERVASMTRLAAEYVSRLHGISVREASPAEIVWWIARAPRRGVAEPRLPNADTPAPIIQTRRGAIAALSEVIVDEGGKTDLVEGGIRGARRASVPSVDVLRRRFVKTMTADSSVYQAFITLSELPPAWTFPGGEFFARLDDSGVAVDWQARLTIVPNQLAKDRTRKQTRQLRDQYGEWDTEAGIEPPSELANANAEVEDLADRLSRSSTEVEIQAHIVMCVWADTADEVNRRADLVASIFTGNHYQVARPVGEQAALFASMLPGAVMPRVLRDYRQHLLAHDFATTMPFITHELGDPSGALLGLTLDGGLCRPMLWDVSRGCRTNSSSSFAVCGELGSGKSVILKTALFHTLARLGGRVIAIDRTASQEYVRYAGACPGSVASIPITDEATISVDPLRIFDEGSRRMHALSFFNTLLDLPTTQLPGFVMDRAVSAVCEGSAPGSRQVIEELQRIAQQPDAPGVADQALVLAERLRHIAADPLGRVIFDESLPPLRFDAADAMFFATHDVPLPTAAQLGDARSADRVDPRRLLGRALHVTIAAIAREIAFGDPRFVLVLFDECYSITDSPDGQALVEEIIRDGRKHYCAVGLGGHVVENFGTANVRNLITTRFVGRHTDPDLAASSLAWVIDAQAAEDTELVESVRMLSPRIGVASEDERRAGEFLVRHGSNIGALKVLIPPYRDLPDAIRTTPIGSAAIGVS